VDKVSVRRPENVAMLLLPLRERDQRQRPQIDLTRHQVIQLVEYTRQVATGRQLAVELDSAQPAGQRPAASSPSRVSFAQPANRRLAQSRHARSTRSVRMLDTHETAAARARALTRPLPVRGEAVAGPSGAPAGSPKEQSVPSDLTAWERSASR